MVHISRNTGTGEGTGDEAIDSNSPNSCNDTDSSMFHINIPDIDVDNDGNSGNSVLNGDRDAYNGDATYNRGYAAYHVQSSLRDTRPFQHHIASNTNHSSNTSSNHNSNTRSNTRSNTDTSNKSNKSNTERESEPESDVLCSSGEDVEYGESILEMLCKYCYDLGVAEYIVGYASSEYDTLVEMGRGKGIEMGRGKGIARVRGRGNHVTNKDQNEEQVQVGIQVPVPVGCSYSNSESDAHSQELFLFSRLGDMEAQVRNILLQCIVRKRYRVMCLVVEGFGAMFNSNSSSSSSSSGVSTSNSSSGTDTHPNPNSTHPNPSQETPLEGSWTIPESASSLLCMNAQSRNNFLSLCICLAIQGKSMRILTYAYVYCTSSNSGINSGT